MNLYKDSNGELFEEITFSNGITEYIYSVDMHKLNSIADSYGLDLSNWNDFNKAKEITKQLTF